MLSELNIFILFIFGACRVVASTKFYDYCIIGAGPGGLQMGYFLQRANRDYIIFERANSSGSFFQTYPRHKKLISINKRHTGQTNKEFNFRHDWNSLISDDESLDFRKYSKEYFPPKDKYVNYLHDYQTKLKLAVQFNTEISNIEKDICELTKSTSYTMSDQRGNSYSCKYLIAATGLSLPNEPKFEGSELTVGYDKMEMDKEFYEGKSVLILGRGNSAFETADHIFGNTNLIHMLSRSRVRLSWSTHYVGDLRAVNNNLLDNYQLKSLDAVLEIPIEEMKVVKRDGRLYIFDTHLFHELEDKGNKNDFPMDNFALRDPYDVIIRCLGWTFDSSIFKNNTKVEHASGRKRKYPFTGYDYQSKNMPNIYFVGTNSHAVDHRKSAGGFIHGFRYTARAVHRIMEWRNHQQPWPSTRGPIKDLQNALIKRMNEASGIYQMFHILGDVVAIRNNGQEYEYFEEFPINLLHEFPNITGKSVDEVIVLSMEYGQNFSGPGNDVFKYDRAVGEPKQAFSSNFLHPVLYYYTFLPSEKEMAQKGRDVLPRPNRIHHIVEDFLTNFSAPLAHIIPLRRFIETCLDSDMRSFFAVTCFKLGLTVSNLPKGCEDFLNGQGLTGTKEQVQMAKASMTFSD